SETSSTPPTPTRAWPTLSATATGGSLTPGRGSWDHRNRVLTPRDGGCDLRGQRPILGWEAGITFWGQTMGKGEPTRVLSAVQTASEDVPLDHDPVEIQRLLAWYFRTQDPARRSAGERELRDAA